MRIYDAGLLKILVPYNIPPVLNNRKSRDPNKPYYPSVLIVYYNYG